MQNWSRFSDAMSPAFLTPWQMLAVTAGVVVLAWLVVRARTWFRDDEDSTVVARELARTLEESKDRGDLSDEEFRLIKSRLASEERDRAATRVRQSEG